MGIFLAITALFAWGFGDFLIQKSTRKFGDWIALFYVTAFGAIALYPFVYGQIGAAFTNHALLLWSSCFVILIASLFDFEGLRIGKMSVIAPIFSLEIPITGLLAAVFVGEYLTKDQIILSTFLVLGLFLVSTRSHQFFRHFRFERGVWYAIGGVLGMGLTTFLFGVASREISPLMINWFTDTFLAAASFIYITLKGELPKMLRYFGPNKQLIINVGFLDKLAWVTFSYSMLYIPIAIATGVSEGYIALSAALGLWLNKEKLKAHQWVGFFVAFVALIALAIVTNK